MIIYGMIKYSLNEEVGKKKRGETKIVMMQHWFCHLQMKRETSVAVPDLIIV